MLYKYYIYNAKNLLLFFSCSKTKQKLSHFKLLCVLISLVNGGTEWTFVYLPTYRSIYLSLDPEGRRGTTDDLATSCLHLCLSATALCDLCLAHYVITRLDLFYLPLVVRWRVLCPAHQEWASGDTSKSPREMSAWMPVSVLLLPHFSPRPDQW